jgi:hypothetical protein
MEWVKIQTFYDSEKQALKTASIVETTEARLASQKHGSQYEIETRVEPVGDKWQVLWRKVFVGNKIGCNGGCKSCGDNLPDRIKGKVLPFKKPLH